MKKVLVILFVSSLIFTGCGTSGLKRSSELVNTTSDDYMFVDEVTRDETIEDNYRSNLNIYARINAKETFDAYSDKMSAEVSSTNARGGATGDVYTVGNATIGLINELVEYFNNNLFGDFDAEFVYNKLIEIRDNMKRIGFLD